MMNKDELKIVSFYAEMAVYLSLKDYAVPSRFRKMLRRLRQRFFPQPTYVIIYDGKADETEQYYGYFSSPAEARALWASFGTYADHSSLYENVKLCRVVEDWKS